MKDEESIDELADELTQKYFQRFGTFTCSWENVREILRERIEIEQSLKEQNKKLRCCGNCKKGHSGFCSLMGFDENYKLWEMKE